VRLAGFAHHAAVPSPASHSPAARLLSRSAAILYLIAMLTGGLAALALSGQISADGHIMLGAHVSALTAALILLGVAYTLPMLRYGAVGSTRLAWGFIVASYGNWAISSAKAFPAVHGVGMTGDRPNDIVFLLLNVFVVAPSLAASVAWIAGFHGRASDRS
jgi:(hydroxyamino)benzene mutase